MHIRKTLLTLGMIVPVSGCAISQTVDPFIADSDYEVCIIKDADVREGFLREYRRTLNLVGVKNRTLAGGASIQDCPVTSTYTARWSWDLTIYMAYAEIIVYENGNLAGFAIYDSRKGAMRLDKWKDAEPKIRELVEELFPGQVAARL